MIKLIEKIKNKKQMIIDVENIIIIKELCILKFYS